MSHQSSATAPRWWRLSVSCLPCLRSLRAKFILVIVLVQAVVMSLVTLVVERQQRQVIMHEFEKRATALATHLEALSEGYLLSYNFVKLEQIVAELATVDDVVYAMVHTHDGTVAAYSDHPEQQGRLLDDAVSRQALQADQLLVQTVTTPSLKGPGYDVAIPVFTAGGTRKWGTVRLGFSLARALQAIQTTRANLLLLSALAILCGTGGAIFLAMRIAKPIQQLMAGVNTVAKGDYDQAIAAISHDDIGKLARQVETMRQALRRHIARLGEEKQALDQANQRLQAMQEELIQREKLATVGRLAAEVAHEVNNPLAIIKMSLRLLKKHLPATHPGTDTVLGIEQEIDRMARTIRQLLDMARPVSSQPSLVEVNAVIEQLLLLLDAELTAHGVSCARTLDAALPLLRIVPDHLRQILLNLLKNAREAMPGGGTLHLGTTPHANGIRISVRDEGIGIPAEHLPVLFEPFFSTKHAESGLGLGLAISASLVKSYGGTLEVVSQPGLGSTFHIFFPTDRPDRSKTPPTRETAEATKEDKL